MRWYTTSYKYKVAKMSKYIEILLLAFSSISKTHRRTSLSPDKTSSPFPLSTEIGIREINMTHPMSILTTMSSFVILTHHCFSIVAMAWVEDLLTLVTINVKTLSQHL